MRGLFHNFFGRQPHSENDPKDVAFQITMKGVSPAKATSIFLHFKQDPDLAWKKLLEFVYGGETDPDS